MLHACTSEVVKFVFVFVYYLYFFDVTDIRHIFQCVDAVGRAAGGTSCLLLLPQQFLEVYFFGPAYPGITGEMDLFNKNHVCLCVCRFRLAGFVVQYTT